MPERKRKRERATSEGGCRARRQALTMTTRASCIWSGPISTGTDPSVVVTNTIDTTAVLRTKLLITSSAKITCKARGREGRRRKGGETMWKEEKGRKS
jgi:hypothetical protein